MIRRLTILLLIVVGLAHEEVGEMEKQMLYKQNDRSPLLAGICALTPTMGHLYLGEWNKRLIPEKYHRIGILSFGAFAYYASKEKYGKGWEHYEEWRDKEFTSHNIASVIFLSWYFLTIQDAIYLAYQHNADLYEEIYGKEYIKPPKKSIIQKIINSGNETEIHTTTGQELIDLKQALDSGAITQEEYDELKLKIMERLDAP